MKRVPKRKVAIVGAFTTPCRGRWLSKTLWELGQWAVSGALQDAKLDLSRVEAGVIGLYNDIFARQAIPECAFQGHLGLAFKPLVSGDQRRSNRHLCLRDRFRYGRRRPP